MYRFLLPAAVFFSMFASIASFIMGRYNKRARNVFVISAQALVLAVSVCMFIAFTRNGGVEFRIGSLLFVLDGFRAMYLMLAGFMWLMTALLSLSYLKHYHNRNRYWAFTFLTLSGLMGVLLSGDLMTAFVFFEIMSFSSYAWVAHDESSSAMCAGDTYLAVSVISGFVMLMGLFLLYNTIGTLEISALSERCAAVSERGGLWAAGICLLVGFGAKAGMFPLHIWLPKAHPSAPAPASALLSGILTKAGIFGVIVICVEMFLNDEAWGTMLFVLSLITMFIGALLAIFSINLKRTLACSSISQIGFILLGVAMTVMLGDENAYSANGTVLHMMNHSMIKLVLFSLSGIVIMNLHTVELNEIKGFGRKKPLILTAFLTGAASIAGLPLTCGYISKTLLHEGIIEYIAILNATGRSTLLFTVSEWIFLLTGGMTFAYMSKLFAALFIDKAPEKVHTNKKYISGAGAFALALPTLLLILWGIAPNLFMLPAADIAAPFMRRAEAHSAHLYSFESLTGAIITIILGCAIYFLFIRRVLVKDGRYLDRWNKKLDLEELIYRPILTRVLPAALGKVFGILSEKAVPAFIDRFMRLLGYVCTFLSERLFEPCLQFVFKGAIKASEGIDSIPDALTGVERDAAGKEGLQK